MPQCAGKAMGQMLERELCAFFVAAKKELSVNRHSSLTPLTLSVVHCLLSCCRGVTRVLAVTERCPFNMRLRTEW